MVCEGSRGFAISLGACDLIREPERNSKPGYLLHDGLTAEWRDNSRFAGKQETMFLVAKSLHANTQVA
jgi:hypothetical protein